MLTTTAPPTNIASGRVLPTQCPIDHGQNHFLCECWNPSWRSQWSSAKGIPLPLPTKSPPILNVHFLSPLLPPKKTTTKAHPPSLHTNILGLKLLWKFLFFCLRDCNCSESSHHSFSYSPNGLCNKDSPLLKISSSAPSAVGGIESLKPGWLALVCLDSISSILLRQASTFFPLFRPLICLHPSFFFFLRFCMPKRPKALRSKELRPPNPYRLLRTIESLGRAETNA